MCLPACTSEILQLDRTTLASSVSRHKRMVVIMHEGASPTLSKFQPWLFVLSTLMPRMPIGRVDLSGEGRGVGTTFKVSGGPAVKMFLRDNPKGERIVDYRGPLEFDALLSWCRAVIAGQGSDHSAPGYEPPEHAKVSHPKGGKGANKLDKLPPSVRAMAETMVREQRLQRLLKDRPGMVERYEDLVSARYQQIISGEGTDVENKFASQEANRRARDQVRTELLESAPDDIREEVERDVHLGDAGKFTGSHDGQQGKRPNEQSEVREKKKKKKRKS